MPSHATTLAPLTSDIGYLDMPAVSADPDRLRMAVAGFLAKYTGSTLAGYRYDLNLFLAWCANPDHHVDPLAAKRGHLELYIRWMETTGWASATIAKRYDTIRGFFRAADRDELLDGKDPCTWVERPKVDSEAQRRTVLQPLAFTLFLAAAKKLGPQHHAFASLLGINALRIAELCSLNIEDMTVEDGYDILHFVGKGGKTAAVPLSVPVMRAVRDAIDGRTQGPVVVTKWKTRMTPTTARRMVKEIARAAGVDTDISPHSLRRSYATTASSIGVSLRDIQNTMRHASPQTTGIYIRDGKSHDRNSTHRVASFVAGMSG